jgi:hypothetical protein
MLATWHRSSFAWRSNSEASKDVLDINFDAWTAQSQWASGFSLDTHSTVTAIRFVAIRCAPLPLSSIFLQLNLVVARLITVLVHACVVAEGLWLHQSCKIHNAVFSPFQSCCGIPGAESTVSRMLFNWSLTLRRSVALMGRVKKMIYLTAD